MTIEVIDHAGNMPALRSFDASRYYDPAHMEAEWARLWRNQWLLAGLESDLDRPGDFFVFDLGREQILLSRTAAGDVRAFFNVCQHRGNRLVVEERGHAARFRCGYHAWTYDLDGRLRAVPDEDRFPDGVPCAERSLRPVACELWNGFVFVHLGDSPMPLADWLGPVADHLAPYRFGEMVLMEDQTVQLACNWKAVVDNFSELYHVEFLHPQHRRMVDCCNDVVHLFAHGHTGLAVPGATVNPRFPVPDAPTDLLSAQLTSLGLDPETFRGRVLDIRAAVQERKREVGAERGFDYSAFRDDQLSDVWQYNLFPNTILSFTPEHCWILRPRPHPTDPTRCEFDKLSLVRFADPDLASAPSEILGPGRTRLSETGCRPADWTRPERDVFDHHAVIRGDKTMTDTIDQDVELLPGVQAGMASAGFDSVWLSRDEIRIQHFHDALDSQLAQHPQGE